MSKNKNNKGQGALEYLLIIGGAIVVAVIAVSVVISLGQRNTEAASDSSEQFETMVDSTIIPPIILSVDCTTSGAIYVQLNPTPTPGVTDYCLYYNGTYIDNSCGPISGNTVTFSVTGGMDTSRQQIAVSAKKGNTQSSPSAPPSSCIPHN